MTQNIFQKLAEVAQAVPYVKKASETGVGGKGVARDELVAKVRGEFLKRGVLVSTSQVAPGSTVLLNKWDDKQKSLIPAGVLYTGMYATSFINVADPTDRYTVQHEGHGKDTSDKAPGKASTYAEKLNIIKALFLETGIADEQRYPEDEEGAGDGAVAGGFPVDQLDAMVATLQQESDVGELRKKLGAFQKKVRAGNGTDSDIKVITEAATKRSGELKEPA